MIVLQTCHKSKRYCVAAFLFGLTSFLSGASALAIPESTPGDEEAVNKEVVDQVWSVLDSFPSDIDIAAMFNNPAEHLLSESGHASRSFLGSFGLFAKTRRAWEALAELFETDADGVVKALMAGRVVLLADSLFDESSNPFELINRVDTNWVVMAEVHRDAIDGLLRRLKPVPREIVGGVPVYAIEQGRYALVMLSRPGNDKNALDTVMLAPKGARGLLERAMQTMQMANPTTGQSTSAPKWENDQQWTIAVRVRVDDWSDQNHVRGMVGESDQGYEVSLCMPHEGQVPGGRPPVGILGSLQDDTVMAMAISSVVELRYEEGKGLNIGIRDEENNDGYAQVLYPDGALIVMSKEDIVGLTQGQEAAGVTVMAMFGVDQKEINARWVDGLVEPMLLENETGEGSGRSYDGLFPQAIRSHRVTNSAGQPASVSWKTTRRTGVSDIIFSLGDEPIDTAQRVRTLDTVAMSLDALAGEPSTGSAVLMSGFIELGAFLESLAPLTNLFPQQEPQQESRQEPQQEMVNRVQRLSWQLYYDDENDGSGVLRARLLFEKGREGVDLGVGLP